MYALNRVIMEKIMSKQLIYSQYNRVSGTIVRELAVKIELRSVASREANMALLSRRNLHRNAQRVKLHSTNLRWSSHVQKDFQYYFLSVDSVTNYLIIYFLHIVSVVPTRAQHYQAGLLEWSARFLWCTLSVARDGLWAFRE